MAANTRRGYDSQWRTFAKWCAERSFASLPAARATLLHYIIERADLVGDHGGPRYAVGTISNAIAAINKVHTVAGFEPPGDHVEVREVLSGISRENDRATVRMRPMTADILREALHAIAFDGPHSAGPIGRRDYAILLLGFAGAFRRSELAALTVKDVTVTSGALHIQIRRSKTDQEGHGQMKALPIGKDPTTCPPCAYFRWIEQIVVRATATSKSSRVLDWAFHQHACDERNDETALLRPDQPLFPALRKGGQLMDHAVSGGTINNVVKKRLAAIGLDASQYGGHSLRSGFVTQAFRAGATHHEVMRQTGHRDPTTVEIYSREYEPLRQNAVLRLGL